jgi:hypothetical protein
VAELAPDVDRALALLAGAARRRCGADSGATQAKLSPPVTAAKLRLASSATSSLLSASFARELRDLPILPGELSGQGQLRALIPVGPNSDREGTHSTDDRANEGQVLEEPTHRRRPSLHRRHGRLSCF